MVNILQDLIDWAIEREMKPTDIKFIKKENGDIIVYDK